MLHDIILTFETRTRFLLDCFEMSNFFRERIVSMPSADAVGETKTIVLQPSIPLIKYPLVIH